MLRTLSDDEIAWKVSGTKSYQDLTVRSLQTLKEVVPLTAVEPNRQRIDIDIEGVVPLVTLKNA